MVIRSSEFEASDVVRNPGSSTRHPLSVFPSLDRVLSGPVPRLHQYYEGAATSSRPSHRASFPSFGGTSVALVVFAPRQTSAPPRPGVGNPVSPAGNLRGDGGSPKFLGNLNCPFAHVPIRLRQDCQHQTMTVQQRGPWSINSKGSYEWSFEAQ